MIVLEYICMYMCLQSRQRRRERHTYIHMCECVCTHENEKPIVAKYVSAR